MKFDIPFPSVVKDVITRLFSFTEAAYPAITPGPKLFIVPCIIILPTEIKLCWKILGTATADMSFKSTQENTEALPSVFIAAKRLNTNIIAKMQLIPWQINVAHATPATPRLNAVTNKISIKIFAVDEQTRNIKGVFESPSAEKIPVAML